MDILIDILQSVLAGFWNSRYTEYIIHLQSKDGKSGFYVISWPL